MRGWLNARTTICLAILALLACPKTTSADVVRLKGGGVVRGKLQKFSRRAKPKQPTVIRTLSGALVTIEASEIESVRKRRLDHEEYEHRRRTAADTVADQWELAQWCVKNRLLKYRKTHLQKIIEIDPDHLAARRGLGHQLYDGEWMSRDEYMLSRGQVRYRGKYVFPQELEEIRKEEAAKSATREWHQKIKLWHAWTSSNRPERRQQAVANLTAVTDPNAIPALSKRFREDSRIRFRRLYLQILSGIESEDVLKPLLYQAIFDEKQEIRQSAVLAVAPNFVDKAVAALVRGLKSDHNFIVGRSAMALAVIADEQVVPQLIDALITTHKYRVVVPDNGEGTIAMRADGSGFSNGSSLPPDVEIMLLTGQLPHGAVINRMEGPQLRKKTQIVKRVQRNEPVLEALKHITGEDFSYDRQAWRLWWTKKKNTVG